MARRKPTVLRGVDIFWTPLQSAQGRRRPPRPESAWPKAVLAIDPEAPRQDTPVLSRTPRPPKARG